jgi:NAD(P)-dependent dehydrogenase (short-subunit alcohol dehydrogenase family)
VLLADLRQENADAAAEVLKDAGFTVSTTTVDVSRRESVHALVQSAVALGDVTGASRGFRAPGRRPRSSHQLPWQAPCRPTVASK